MAVFIVDDHPLVRTALGLTIQRLSAQIEVVEVDRLAQLRPAVVRHGVPDLVCLDLQLPDAIGMSTLKAVHQMLPDTPLVVISAQPADDYADIAMEYGAAVYVEKTVGAHKLAGILSPYLVQETAEDPIAESLSDRQKEQLRMLISGMSNRQIADSLGLSVNTVKFDLWRLYKQLHVSTRTQASHLARQRRLVDSV